MNHCPCCGLFYDSNLFVECEIRPKVVICITCSDDIPKRDGDNWWVDKVDVTDKLRKFNEMWNKYSDVMNCSDDKKEVEAVSKVFFRLRKAHEGRFILFVDAEDGSHVIGEFLLENWARAKMMGFAGRNYTLTGKDSLVTSHGASLQYQYLPVIL
jgi:hypothetical protein